MGFHMARAIVRAGLDSEMVDPITDPEGVVLLYDRAVRQGVPGHRFSREAREGLALLADTRRGRTGGAGPSNPGPRNERPR